MFGAKVKVAGNNTDIRTNNQSDMAFDSDLFLPKLYRNKRSTSTSSFAHGLGYTPSTIFARELSSSPKVYGYTIASNLGIDQPSVDSTNINFRLMSHYTDFTTSPYTSANDTASIALLMIDPLGTPSPTPVKSQFEGPRFIAGNTSGPDYDTKIHSRYDTLKVASSGVLTLSVPSWTPNASDEYDVVSTSYSHNLGYVPMFSPMIPCQISLPIYYSWYWQWNNRHAWATTTEYLVDNYVSSGVSFYKCKKYHTSSSATQPGIGAQWTTYWDLIVGGAPSEIPTTIDLNALEDIKYVYGGVFVLDDEELEAYITDTQLVVKLHRIADGTFGYTTFPARTITLSYTIFVNRLDEEYNILS